MSRGVTFVESSLAKAAGARSTARFDVRVIYERKIDAAAERDRLNKELTKLTQELTRAIGQLSNEAFLSKAPAHVVEGLKKRRSEVEILVQKTNEALGELGFKASGSSREIASWIGQAARSPPFWKMRCWKIAPPVTLLPTPASTPTSALPPRSLPNKTAYFPDWAVFIESSMSSPCSTALSLRIPKSPATPRSSTGCACARDNRLRSWFITLASSFPASA